ncbi:MAG: DivIVA domain-containing protein [Schwartzia sp.]|nr:DivIVA domain-containing protein [Schwartzia sp. (in: firmicutes)]
MLTPADIHNKEFSRGFRGYNEEEVDDFLDEIVSAFEELIKQNTRLAEDLELERKKTAQYQEMEKNLHETMDVAQKTADEAVQSAKIRVEEMERAAKEDCERLRHQTEMAIQRRMEDATAKVRVQQELYEAGIARERQFMVRLRSLLRSELAILNADGLTEILGSPDEGAKNPDMPMENKMADEFSSTPVKDA